MQDIAFGGESDGNRGPSYPDGFSLTPFTLDNEARLEDECLQTGNHAYILLLHCS